MGTKSVDRACEVDLLATGTENEASVSVEKEESTVSVEKKLVVSVENRFVVSIVVKNCVTLTSVDIS